MVGATAACLHRVFGTQTMVQATAACLHRVVWHQNHGEGNGRLPSPCVFGGGLGLKGWRGWRGSVWRIATEPNRNAAILAIHRALNTALSTEPPDYNHAYGAGWVWAQSF